MLLDRAIVVLFGAVASAAIPNSSTGVITGCYDEKTGALRVVGTQAG
jgi:hypothetical protein